MCASLPFQPSAYPLPELMLYPVCESIPFPLVSDLSVPPLPSKEGERLANHLALGQELKERAQSPSEAVPHAEDQLRPNSLSCIVTFRSRSRRGFCANLLLFRYGTPSHQHTLTYISHEKKDYIGPPQPWFKYFFTLSCPSVLKRPFRCHHLPRSIWLVF